jgi:molybdenum-dependent DNA-binding transcriptional regulator ModE
MASLNSPLHPKALRYLAAVAQLGSVQAAAREVSISASAIDRQILMLEEDMGVPLFERLPRGMRLTAAGELLLALSQRWKTDLNRTLSDVKQLQGVSQGQLRLAAMDSHVNGFLPGFIHRVAQEHPGIVLEVDVVSTDEAVRCLTEGAVDLAIAFNLKPQRELHLVWTADLPLGCVAATSHALAASQAGQFQGGRRLAPGGAKPRAGDPPLPGAPSQLVAAGSAPATGDQFIATGQEPGQEREPCGANLRARRRAGNPGGQRALHPAERQERPAPDHRGWPSARARSIPRIGRIVADLLADHVERYLAAVRAKSA